MDVLYKIGTGIKYKPLQSLIIIADLPELLTFQILPIKLPPDISYRDCTGNLIIFLKQNTYILVHPLSLKQINNFSTIAL